MLINLIILQLDWNFSWCPFCDDSSKPNIIICLSNILSNNIELSSRSARYTGMRVSFFSCSLIVCCDAVLQPVQLKLVSLAILEAEMQ